MQVNVSGCYRSAMKRAAAGSTRLTGVAILAVHVIFASAFLAMPFIT